MADQSPTPASFPQTPPGLRRLLVPVRGGADALARVRLAVHLAAATGAEVTALYVLDERLLADPDAALVRDTLIEQLTQEGEAVLATVREAAAQYQITFHTRLERGPVVETVLRIATAIDAEMIIVGAHKQTWLGRLLGRSVAESILNGARCAVLAVPPGEPDTGG